ncbi:outer membrane protein assembly factor BamB family protein [Micromonospora sp. NBC_01813]|uniref:outer membrane protein assembly factor BamB family protein n=1 Tax=Micromonospora sp. NBC_01813 TaxID=2975988 RepID=UPI002DDC6536|nr:PQQ-binding-like beta-propeller repeat protein [Micromonospora sp. NBC_01813]WSA08714.1 PQQ-binding-like beta-propeller repeat protein [Micromonospora sp. NBC_01813]
MVIELGLAREPETPPAAAGGWWRGASSDPAGGGRSLVRRVRPYAVFVCLALLLGLAGATPPDGPLLVQVAAHQVKARDIVLAGDRLLVTSAAAQGSSTTWQLSAYAIPAGDLLWTVPFDAASWRLRQVRRTGDVVLVDPRSGPGSGATVVLDADTGRTRWVARSGLTLTDDGRTALLDEPGGPDGTASTLVAVDVTSGDELWRTELTASTEVLTGPDGQALLVGADGRAELRDGRDGTVLRTADLGAVSRPDSMAGALLMRQSTGGELGVAGYDPATLRQLWQRPVRYGPGRITECGRLICFPAGPQIEAVDPLTGESVWRIDADLVVDFDSYLVAYSVSGGTAGAAGGSDASGGASAALSSTSTEAGAGSGRIVDPVTGRTLLALSAWYTELEGRGDATFVGYRQPVEDGPAWLAVLAPATRTVRLVGTVPGPVGGCVADPATIVCRSGAEGITVWRYQL